MTSSLTRVRAQQDRSEQQHRTRRGQIELNQQDDRCVPVFREYLSIARLPLYCPTYGDVSTFVIRVNGNIQSHELNELLIFTETKESSQVGGVILVLVDSWEFTITIYISENPSSNIGEFSDQIHRVVEGSFPVFFLVDTV